MSWSIFEVRAFAAAFAEVGKGAIGDCERERAYHALFGQQGS